MSYSELAVIAVFVAVCVDLFVFKNSLLTRLAFWLSYMIILPFQLMTNWWLTHIRSDGQAIVMYDPDVIVGYRLAGAPIEDEFWGRRGFQREKNSR
jgi:lycopene cyclase domain-containing protein